MAGPNDFMREFHQQLGACFTTVGDAEAVAHYGQPLAEYQALRQTAGVLDLSFRSRLCLTGADRGRFLHGQVSNDIKRLRPGEGCYAALVSAKGRMESDLNVYSLAEELLLDFEPGLRQTVTDRLQKYIVADDVQVVDVAALFGLLSVQGPEAAAVLRAVQLFGELPSRPFDFVKIEAPTLGELYLSCQPRLATAGFDLFAPTASLSAIADKLAAAAGQVGGRLVGWEALEWARVEAGIPRFGVDMDERNLPQECGIEERAVSYSKGCYIGQEVLNRVHTMGHVNRALCGLHLGNELTTLPARNDKVFYGDKDVGYITSAVVSPALGAKIALGYVRTEARQPGRELRVHTAAGEGSARVIPLPLAPAP